MNLQFVSSATCSSSHKNCHSAHEWKVDKSFKIIQSNIATFESFNRNNTKFWPIHSISLPSFHDLVQLSFDFASLAICHDYDVSASSLMRITSIFASIHFNASTFHSSSWWVMLPCSCSKEYFRRPFTLMRFMEVTVSHKFDFPMHEALYMKISKFEKMH